jgi:hypothetical protein
MHCDDGAILILSRSWIVTWFFFVHLHQYLPVACLYVMRKRKEKPPTENPTSGLLSQNRSNNRLAQHKEVMQWKWKRFLLPSSKLRFQIHWPREVELFSCLPNSVFSTLYSAGDRCLSIVPENTASYAGTTMIYPVDERETQQCRIIYSI